MTHLEKFVALYKEVGIDLKPELQTEENCSCPEFRGQIWLCIDVEDQHNKVEGYPFFYTNLIFNKDGSFLKQEIGE